MISNYKGGAAAIAGKLQPMITNSLVREALANLRKGFESVEHIGPKLVTDFEEINSREEIERIRRDVFERVNRLLEIVNDSSMSF